MILDILLQNLDNYILIFPLNTTEFSYVLKIIKIFYQGIFYIFFTIIDTCSTSLVRLSELRDESFLSKY